MRSYSDGERCSSVDRKSTLSFAELKIYRNYHTTFRGCYTNRSFYRNKNNPPVPLNKNNKPVASIRVEDLKVMSEKVVVCNDTSAKKRENEMVKAKDMKESPEGESSI